MKILIVEDEYHAQKRLKHIIQEIRPKTEILSILDSVEDTIEWLAQYQQPDLIFLDIQLSDGLSFEIFTKIDVQVPVIFTTAFDEYALKAFKINSVDYLLKPIEEEDLEQAIIKFEKHFQQKVNYDLSTIDKLVKSLTKPSYKSRFLIKSGQNLSYVPVEEIAYFYSENSFSFIKTKTGKKHLIDGTMDQVSLLVNPQNFFRINRKSLIHVSSIKKVSPYFNSRVILKLVPDANFEAIVSREKVKEFKNWLGA